ncbi:DUF6521 family protein [Klebsiella pneumoniae]|nr:three component ABC system middle component [Klebsiella pneumoniae]MDM7506630.1 DUF6521 family protein [Klebsiella pneumoniae]
MLILPIIFHKKSLDYLAHKKTNTLSFQDLLLTKPEIIVSINKRFYNFLPSSVNCVSLCLENGIAELEVSVQREPSGHNLKHPTKWCPPNK